MISLYNIEVISIDGIKFECDPKKCIKKCSVCYHNRYMVFI